MHQSDKTNILLVDGQPDGLLAMEQSLASPAVQIVTTNSGNDALKLMIEQDFAVVILDTQLSDMEGFEAVVRIKRCEKTRTTPLIFSAALSNEGRSVLECYESGAVDCLSKPIDPQILKCKVQLFIDLDQQKKTWEKTSRELALKLDELEQANRKILDQQKSLIEEERLKVLMQMTGATAHELNQPLTILLSHIEFVESGADDKNLLAEDLAAIKDAGLHIADIVQKMQATNLKHIRPSLFVTPGIQLEREVHILAVEDSDADFNAISSCLAQENQVHLSRAQSIHSALHALKAGQADLIFLDYVLPDGNARTFIEAMEESGDQTPIVVVTGQGDEMIAAELIQAGAYDYLPKSRINSESVLRIIVNTLEKVRLKGEIRDSQLIIAEMSTKDPLTDLYNRRYFTDCLERSILGANRYKNDLLLCMMDLDQFKQINDTHGHVAGDKVLTEIGEILKACLRESDLACRYGGDELSVILPNATPENAVVVCERFREKVDSNPFSFEDTRIHVTISIGIAPYKSLKGSPTVTSMLAAADKALYQAKKAGRNRVLVYSE